MKPVLVNLQENDWYYLNLDRLTVKDRPGGRGAVFSFPITKQDWQGEMDRGDADLFVEGTAEEWQTFLSMAMISAYKPHPEGDWKNWCQADADGNIAEEVEFW